MATVADDAIVGQGVNQMIAYNNSDGRFWATHQQSAVAGTQVLLERMRSSADNIAKTVDATVVQALNGTNPTLADYTEALRSARDQPQTTGALINPGVTQGQPGTGGTGANPSAPGKTITVTPTGTTVTPS